VEAFRDLLERSAWVLVINFDPRITKSTYSCQESRPDVFRSPSRSIEGPILTGPGGGSRSNLVQLC